MEHSPDNVCNEYENHSSETMEAHEKYRTKTIRPFWETIWTVWKITWGTSSYNEIYAIIRATLLVFSIFYWCYYSLQHGPREFTILENEQVLPGLVFSKKAVVAFSYGYSTWNSIIYAISAIILIYSVIWKRPLFSLPLMGFFLAEMMYDICNVIVVIWLIFKNLQLQTALPYTIMILLMIIAEIWMWLGVVQLYEHRVYESY